MQKKFTIYNKIRQNAEKLVIFTMFDFCFSVEKFFSVLGIGLLLFLANVYEVSPRIPPFSILSLIISHMEQQGYDDPNFPPKSRPFVVGSESSQHKNSAIEIVS
jgi:hypothetical protein